MTRALATIRRINDIQPIPGADKIETAVIDGWTVVVKKDEFKINDLCVYLEIDSWVPHTLAPFLTKPGHFPKVYNNVEGQRLKNVRLRGQLSQGLVLPLSVLPKTFVDENGEGDTIVAFYVFEEGNDVTEILGIQKWEKPLAACLAGIARGNFPSAVPKTDQERIQNLNRNLEGWVEQELDWEVAEKLHGSSCTFYFDDEGTLHVCSRNLNLQFSEENAFWRAAIKYNMQSLDLRNIAIQGELIGSGINGNQYGLDNNEIDFYTFDVYDTVAGNYIKAQEREEFCKNNNLKHVPVIRIGKLPGHSVNEILKYADGNSLLNNSLREGLVFKCIQKPELSFKAVSNVWLDDGGDDQ